MQIPDPTRNQTHLPISIYLLSGPSQYLPTTPYKMIAFPQPTRPVNSFYQESSQPQNSTTVISDNMGRQAYGPKERSAEQHAPATTMGDGEKETREEHWGAILELYDKLPQSIKTQVNLDKFDVPRNVLRDLKVDSSSQRSAEEGSTIEKLSRKLERFKIRTVQGGGVVREEEDRS
ncbi:hypothetical protein DKX38_010939 [Salix brachista]|uniref:Uncharacterized protein n=1 Tax=Salix brachista TaxID=2182728 RepID=A0A5N5M032_9ROSI|nr:hypothetical protein DKX38_010939 [Salix brachista]